jgi:hypothetical protein
MTLPPISEVWARLGGGPLRHGRGRAFWRGGEGFNVSLDDQKNVWHDFVANEGGGVLDLVMRIRGCDRRGAYTWVAAEFTLPTSDLTPAEREAHARQRAYHHADLRNAQMFAVAAYQLADALLEDLDACDLQRGPLTRLIASLRTDAGILLEYRQWRERHPTLTRALVAAGRKHQERLEILMSNFLVGELDHAA